MIWKTKVIACATLLVASAAVAGPRQDRAKVAAQAYRDCVVSQSERLASQNESAETLATAALGLCSAEASMFRTAFKESTREYGLPFASTANQDQLNEANRLFEDEIKKTAVTTIVVKRSRQ